MKMDEIERYDNSTEKHYLDLSNQIAEKIIREYKKVGPYININGTSTDGLLYNYFKLKKKGKNQTLDKILNRYNINYSSSINRAIYDLLNGEKNRSLLWPGVISEEDDGLLYRLETSLGTIKVYKASAIFKNTKSSYIFKENLMNCCFARSLDFLYENRDYKAVLSYNNNILVGGYFHAYLEKDDITLDIAGNALYKSMKDKDKVLKGEVLAKLTYDEALDEFAKVLEEILDLDSDDDKLQVLALYYGKKKGIK